MSSQLNNVKIYADCVESLRDERLFAAAYYFSSEDRKKKTDSLKNENARLLSIGAEKLLISALEDYGIHNEKPEYGYTNTGKPYLVKHPEIHFNLSHSGDYVFCAVADREVGCDIEKIRDIDLRVAKKAFSDREYDYLMSRPDEERRDCFFRLWTLKESFMKACGLGMKLEMKAFAIGFDGDKITVSQNVNDKEYEFCEYDIIKGYHCSVCAEKVLCSQEAD